MEQENLEEQDSLNPESGEEDTLKPQEEEDSEKDDSGKLKELADNYKARSEKREIEIKELKKELETLKGESEKSKTELSQVDIITLAKADIHEEDIDEVLEYARFKKVPVKEALNSNVMKSLLAERKEERKTAEATSAGGKRAGTRAKSSEDLLSDAETGKMPDSEEGIRELVEARFKSKARK